VNAIIRGVRVIDPSVRLDLAGQDGQIDAGESLRAAEALGEPAHLEEGAGPRRSGSLCCGRLYAAVRHFFRPQSFA